MITALQWLANGSGKKMDLKTKTGITEWRHLSALGSVFSMAVRFVYARLCRNSKGLPATISRFLFVLIIGLSSVGCAGMVSKQVSDAQRDQSGKYDGIWHGKISGGGSIQYIGKQGLRCSKQDATVHFAVKDGKLRVVAGMSTRGGDTNVGIDGKFRLEIPTDQKYSGGGFNVQKPGVTLIVQGNLAENVKKGLYVVGMGQLNNEGCSYRVGFVPVATRGYTNKYKGIFAGVTSRGTVIGRFGDPVNEKSSGRYSFNGGFDLTFDKQGRVNTIIIYNSTYTDRHGMKVGMSVDELSEIDDIEIRSSNAVDTKYGIVYWFDKQNKISEIVLASKLLSP